MGLQWILSMWTVISQSRRTVLYEGDTFLVETHGSQHWKIEMEETPDSEKTKEIEFQYIVEHEGSAKKNYEKSRYSYGL